jgi:hypothetical protein
MQDHPKQPNKTRITVIILAFASDVYLSLGHLKWLPDWVPLVVIAGAAIYWLFVEQSVRAVVGQWFKTETGRIIHPETNRPARQPKIRWKKAIITVLAVAILSTAIGTITYRFRVKAFSVVADFEFVSSGKLHMPFRADGYTATSGIAIDNKTREATGLTNWAVSLKFKDGKQVYGRIPFATDQDMPLSIGTYDGKNMSQLTLKPADYLPLRAPQPIPPGGGIWGWIPADWESYSEKDVRGHGVTLVVEFDEIATGEHHIITNYLDAPSDTLPPGIVHIKPKGSDWPDPQDR